MATLTIRDLDDEVKRRLRVRAAEKGVSMEAEVRAILAEAVREQPAEEPGAWYRRMRERLAATGAYWDDVPLPDRKSKWAVSPEEIAQLRAEADAREGAEGSTRADEP